MASIYIKNYMKEKRLLVAKNAKVNKKSFMLIFYQDTLEQIVVYEYQKKKKPFVSFISVFSVKVNGI